LEPLDDIEALVACGERGPGTDAERRAARRLEARLRELGREARVEPILVRPGYALTHLIHAVAGIGGSVVSVSSPLAGAIVLLVTAVSAFGDLTGTFHLARRLTGRRASQNVISGEDGGRPGTLVLVAHYDAGRAGGAFGPRLTERLAALGQAIRRPIGGFEPLFWSIVVGLVCALLRLVGIDATPLTVVQFLATVVLILSVPLLADIALSDTVPGANDNASGVATVLRLAERYGSDLDHFDVWVLLTGAEEGMELGVRAWLRAHRRELDRARTAFLCVDQVGYGTVRYARREGYLIAHRQHRALVELCDQIAEEDAGGEGRYRARSYVSRSATDAHAARVAGFPAISVSCLGALDYARHHHRPSDTVENLDEDALERAFRFCSELVELIDERIGPGFEPAE
jgi:peptidase M28-like protein